MEVRCVHPGHLHGAGGLSFLAGGAPVGDAVRVALAPGGDRRAAARARAARLAVDGALSETGVERAAHELRGFGEDASELSVRKIPGPRPRRDLSPPERLGAPHVPDPGDKMLVEHCLADREALARGTHPLDHLLEVGRLRQDVRTEPAHARVVELEDRPVPEDRLSFLAARDEPRHPAPRSRAVPLEDLPTPLHPEMAPEDEPVLEAQKQVLADRFDTKEPSPVEPARDTGYAGARVRGLDLELLADQRLQPPGPAVARVALGHRVESVCILDCAEQGEARSRPSSGERSGPSTGGCSDTTTRTWPCSGRRS